MSSEESLEKTPAETSTSSGNKVERTVLRPYPKVVFFYLTWLAALVCGIIMATIDDSPKVQHMCAFVFLWVFAFNLMVVSFQFSRMLSVAVLFLGVYAGVLGAPPMVWAAAAGDAALLAVTLVAWRLEQPAV